MACVNVWRLLGYKASIISTIVDSDGRRQVVLGYKASIISTIVDCIKIEQNEQGYKASIISTIVDVEQSLLQLVGL